MGFRVVTMEQAVALGFNRRQVYRMVASHEWTRLYEGVFVMGKIPNENPIDNINGNPTESGGENSSGNRTMRAGKSAQCGLGPETPRMKGQPRLSVVGESLSGGPLEGAKPADEVEEETDRNRRGEEIWKARLSGLLVRGGESAMISHSAAARLHGMEGIRGLPIEATTSELKKFPEGIHRTRYPDLNPIFIEGIRATSIERTLRDLASNCSFEIVEQALESMLRGPDRTRPDLWNTALLASLRESISWHDRLPGTFKLRSVLERRSDTDRPTGSFPETLIFQALREVGLESVCQPTVRIIDGSGALLDQFFPDLGLVGFPTLVEVDGAKAHAGAVALARDLHRQNKLLRGFRILRYPASKILEDPLAVAEEIRRGLAGSLKVGTQWQFDNVRVTASLNSYVVVDQGRDARVEAEIARRRQAS